MLTIMQMVNISYAQRDLLTPLEKSLFSSLSSYEDMMLYLHALDEESKVLSMSIAGRSVMGKDIPLLHFTQDKNSSAVKQRKPRVLIFCQQHGTEPSGKEAALIIARRLAKENISLLEKLDIYLIPQVNPDGAERGRRKNANNVDLNMNHIRLDQPESKAVHDLFLDLNPEVTLDVHEYNAVRKEWVAKGLIRDAEEMLDGPTNVNISSDLIQFSQNKVIVETGARIRREGYRFHRLVIGKPFNDDRMRFSSTAIRDGRQSFGIYNTLSFVLEGKRYADVLTHIRRRTEAQVSAMIAFLQTIAAYDSEIINLVDAAKREIINTFDQENRLIHVQMDYFYDPDYPPIYFPFFDLYKWKHVEKKLKNVYPIIRVKKSIIPPLAYIFESSQKDLISLLKKHRIKIHSVTSDTMLSVEIYKILQDVSSMEEGKKSRNIDILVRIEKKLITPLYKFVFLNQSAGLLIPLLLELQSTWSILSISSGTRKQFKEYAQLNSDYPIWRLPGKTDFKFDRFTCE